ATCAPIVHAGATPVFIDIDPDTWCIDPHWVNTYVTPRTKAIIATHLYGSVCRMDYLWGIGKQLGIPIIEDAAEAIGSEYHGMKAGNSRGSFGVYSFHGSKTITTGEGGMFVTNNDDLYEKALTLSNHGRSRTQTKQFWPDEIGFKFKMSNVQAAIGCAQMQRIDELIARKRQIFEYYYEKLGHLAGVQMNTEPEGTVNGYWMPTAVFAPKTGVTREKLQEAFKRENIDARVFFHPLSSLPMFSKEKVTERIVGSGYKMPDGIFREVRTYWKPRNTNNKWAYDIPTRAINLPSFHDITEEEMDRVIDVIWEVMK
ncbi:MAG: DegT/DnrJ/EryC1/StrS family aminotransferase, partial [Dehalococcoidia bacterium]